MPPERPDWIVHYLCGTCGFDAVGYWSFFQAHYENHRKEGG